jgi:hypothetical protein
VQYQPRSSFGLSVKRTNIYIRRKDSPAAGSE